MSKTMKKITISALAFTLFFGIASAYSPEGINDVSNRYASNPLGAKNLEEVNSNFLKAIQNRHRRYFRLKHEQANGYSKNIYNQRLRHAQNRAGKGVNEVQTDIERGGPLVDRSGIRENSRYRAQRSNAKQTFRARAICYYVEGTDANADCMESGVIYGRDHRVESNIETEGRHRERIANVNANVRDLVRAAAKAAQNDLETKKRTNTYMKGQTSRNFLAPFLRLPFE